MDLNFFDKKVNAIFESDLPDLEKLAQAYGLISSQYVQAAQNEIEVRRALSDRENEIKEQIKLGMMQTARGIFDHCYRRLTGKGAWHE